MFSRLLANTLEQMTLARFILATVFVWLCLYPQEVTFGAVYLSIALGFFIALAVAAVRALFLDRKKRIARAEAWNEYAR